MTTPFVGEIRMFGFGRTPIGWLPCDGRLVSISENELLYALIGTLYGGDGQTTFQLPDLRGRLPIHQGTGPGLSNRPIGSMGGSEQVTLTTAQLPAHTHQVVASKAAATQSAPSNAMLPASVSAETFYVNDVSGAAVRLMADTAVQNSGGNLPHENRMPTLTVQFCIATNGIFPQQA